jgi:hypothetical protein
LKSIAPIGFAKDPGAVSAKEPFLSGKGVLLFLSRQGVLMRGTRREPFASYSISTA